MKKTKNKKQNKKNKKNNIQVAGNWSRPKWWEYDKEYLEEHRKHEVHEKDEYGSFPGEEGPPIPIDEFNKGGQVKRKKPRGWGIARYKGK
jgi:hypothetical protein